MTVEAAFQQLATQGALVREALLELRTTIVEDKPLQGDVVLVDLLGDATDDLLGWLEEGGAAIGSYLATDVYQQDQYRARRALTLAQELFHRMMQCYLTELTNYERVAELMRFGRTRGGEWRVWANSVKESLARCQQPLFELGQFLFQCWQQLAEHSGTTSVSVQATNIGQHVLIADGTHVATP